MKRDLAGVGWEGGMRAVDKRGGDGCWKRQGNGISDEEEGGEIDDRCRCQPHPDFRNKEESNFSRQILIWHSMLTITQ